MRARRPIAASLLALLWLSLPAAAAPAAPVRGLELHKQLQRDPLLVLGIRLDDPAGELQGLTGLLERFAGDGPRSGLPGAAVMNSATAELLRAELLPRLGEEVALVLDLPPVDAAVAALQLSKDEAVAAWLGRTGLLARVQDRPGLDRLIRGWVLAAGGALADSGGLVEIALPLARADAAAQTPDPPQVRLYYAFDGDRWALGFTADWVREVLGPRPQGERLTDGADFKRVFAALDPRPSDLLYLNLPKLHALVTDSQVIRMVLQANAEFRELANRFVTSDTMGVGVGATSVRIDGGVRTMNFGPPWMSGTAVSSGYVAALALPSLLGAVDRGKVRRTGTDIRAIARACEGFSTDSRTYPGPTNGWIPVEKIATYLEPVYIAQLPRIDGWQNPILYWSDGGSYRIISTGRDGRIDRDWTGQVEGSAPEGIDGDIVFGDGQPLVWPNWLSGD